MMVLAPADQTEAKQAIRAIAGIAGPAYMQITREPSDVLFGADYRFQPGRAVTVQEGSDVTLISTGVQTTRTYQAAEILAGRGIGAAVLGRIADMTSIFFVYRVCAWLPAIGLLTGLLPNLDRQRS